MKKEKAKEYGEKKVMTERKKKENIETYRIDDRKNIQKCCKRK